MVDIVMKAVSPLFGVGAVAAAAAAGAAAAAAAGAASVVAAGADAAGGGRVGHDRDLGVDHEPRARRPRNRGDRGREAGSARGAFAVGEDGAVGGSA